MTAPQSLSITVANDLQEVPRVAEQIETFCSNLNVSAKTTYRFNVALEEALTNIISYGFSGGGRHQIDVSVEFRGGELIATVSDDGKPFDPLSQAPPDIHASVEERKVGGLGIHLLRTLMEKVEYRRDGGTNRLTFRTRVDTARG